MTEFYAYYEDRAKTSAACNDPESYVDHAHDRKNATARAFPNLEAAVTWLSKAVDDELTVFGCGTVMERERVEKPCRACVCRGVQAVREHIVSETGIDETIERESDCI